MSNDLVPGHHIENQGSYEKRCEHCKGSVKMLHVIDQQHGGWRWGAFDPKPIETDKGTLLFRRHRCGYQYQQRPQGNARQRGLF